MGDFCHGRVVIAEICNTQMCFQGQNSSSFQCLVLLSLVRLVFGPDPGRPLGLSALLIFCLRRWAWTALFGFLCCSFDCALVSHSTTMKSTSSIPDVIFGDFVLGSQLHHIFIELQQVDVRAAAGQSPPEAVVQYPAERHRLRAAAVHRQQGELRPAHIIPACPSPWATPRLPTQPPQDSTI